MAVTSIKQHDITDCGAACLASVAAHYGLHLPLARIRQYASTDKKGTNVLGLLKAAEKLGFEGKGVKGDFKSLSVIPKPAIAHVVQKQVLHHYVVIYAITAKYVKIMDPGEGRMLNMPHERFKEEWSGVLVLLSPKEEFTPRDEKVSLYKRGWFLLKPHKLVLLQALIGAVIYTLLGFSTAIYLQKITDFVLVGNNTNLLNLLSVVMLILLLLQMVIGTFKDVFLIKSGQQLDVRLILGYYKHLLKLPQPFFDTMRVGEIISRINDAVKIRAFINGISLNLAVNMLIVLFSFALMFSYYSKLALIFILVVPIYAIIYFITNQLNKKTERTLMEKSADLESQLVESLNAMGTIKRFGLESYSNIKTETLFIDLLKTSYKSSLNNIFSVNSIAFISRLFTIILLWCGSYFVINREITAGELISFYAIVGYFTGPVAELIGANRYIQNALIAADRLFGIMDLEIGNPLETMALIEENIGDIIFKDVSFGYGTREQVFQNLDLIIPNGKITAIIGESGSGKSTLTSLLQRLYPLQGGNILIGNTDLRYVDTDSLRDLVGAVPQQIDLFSGNVMENIAVGEFEPNMDRLISVCKKIGILDFVESLPHGFHTHLGENGATLSGGQKQRIAIARALYKEPKILILDEATASLDTDSEVFIQKIVKDLRCKGITIILIAHRLSTIVHADKIVVLGKGKILEEGGHKDLYAHKGPYYQLWQQQTKIP